MRRGLMQWDEDELPTAALDARTRRLQDAMHRGDLQALLAYTNLVRPSAVSYLTGFTPYWSEGVLLLGCDGPPVFVTALSKRVAGWIRSVSPVGEIVNAPRPGHVIGARLAADPSVRRVGVVELDALPAGLFDDLAAAAPNLEWVDATPVFAHARRGADAVERRLTAQADAIAVAALDQVDAAAVAEVGALIGTVEAHARLNRAEEAYILVAPDLLSDRRMIRASRPLSLGSRFAVCASIAYKGHWVRRTRTFAKEAAAARDLAAADRWLEHLVGSVNGDAPLARQIAAFLDGLAGADLRGWTAESCVGSYPLQVVATSAAADGWHQRSGDLLVLTIDLAIAGAPWLGAAPAHVGGGA